MKALLTPSVKHSAPGQYLGFALQPVRMFFYLLSGPPGAIVSLEHLDDVAIHFSDGNVLVEQAKSALSHNPLSDWSTDLWKTIANWIKAVRSGDLDVQRTVFRMYVTPTNKGNFSDILHISSSAEEVKALKENIEKKLAAKTKTPKCLEHLKVFLDASDAERYELVRRIEIVSIDHDPLDALRSLMAPTIPSHLIDVICEAGIGMAKERADRLIRRRLPACVGLDEFRKEFHAFIQKNNMSGYLGSVTPSPDSSAVDVTFMGRPDFVRQLEFIEASDEQQITAVSDYLRTSATKALWAESGMVFAGSFTDWEADLIRRHSSIKSEVNDLLSEKTEVIRGRTVYNRCSTIQPPLDGKVVPGFFTHGSLNVLADDQILGWHPRYLDLLEEGSDK